MRRSWVRQSLFGLSLVANASVLSGLAVLAASRFFPEGERVVGLGLMWAFTLPGVIVSGFAVSFRLPHYLALSNFKSRLGAYALLASATSAAGHLLGWAALRGFG